MTTAWSRLQRIIAFSLLAALVVASAGSAASPGKVDVDTYIRTPLGDVDPEPIPVQNPVLPNLVPEVVDRVGPFLKPLGDVGNSDHGPFADTPLTPPVVTDLWGHLPGVDRRNLEPLKTLLHILNAADNTLPVDLIDVDAAISEANRAVTSEFGVVPGALLSDEAVPRGHHAGEKPTLAAFDEAAVPLQVYDALLRGEDRPPAHPQGFGGSAPLTEAAASSTPSLLGGDGTLAFVIAAGLTLLLLKLFGVPLYHRFKRKTALDNPTRSKLYGLLRDAPGLSAAELSERSGLHVTTVKYHMDVLRKVGMVGEQSVDGTRRFYSYENGDRMEFLSRALLDEPTARRIYAQIESAPGRPFIEVARGVGMRKEHVHYHVKKLAKHGLIADRWVNGRRLLYPAGHADAHPPSPGQLAAPPQPPVPEVPA